MFLKDEDGKITSPDNLKKDEDNDQTSNIYGNDSCNLDYTEEEFIKEFKDEELDEDQNYDDDPR